jgi:Cytochrome c oxidase subunit IV
MRPRTQVVWGCALVFLGVDTAYRFWAKDWPYAVAIALLLCLATSGALGLHTTLTRLGDRPWASTRDGRHPRGSARTPVSLWPILFALAAAAIIVGIALS